MNKRTLFLLALLVLAGGLRIWVYSSMDDVLPMDGLYVDELSYAMDPTLHHIRGFSRPPGMFLLALVLDTLHHIQPSRLIMSLLSIMPSIALFLALRDRKDIWSLICVGGLALSPFLIFFGMQFLPAVPAAVLISFSLLLAWRGKYLAAGVLVGAAAIFRGELLLLPLVAFLLSLGRNIGKGAVFASGAAIAVIPVILVNVIAGAGPVVAVNGSENLWLGSSWDLITTPPGTEFEVLVSVEAGSGRMEALFMDRAISQIAESPGAWVGMGFQKVMAFFTLPGPGRNTETGWLMRKTLLILLLPLTLLAMSTGLANIFTRKREFRDILAVSAIITGVAASFIFFPAARFRTALLPAFWFLAASRIPTGRRIPLFASLLAILVLISTLTTYPGSVRPGLTSVLAGEYMISSGNPQAALEHLDIASRRGFEGSDIHNLYGSAYSVLGMSHAGLTEFQLGIRIAPESPTLWRNYSVSLWNSGRYEESVSAARRAVQLNPLLRDELVPILAHEENN